MPLNNIHVPVVELDFDRIDVVLSFETAHVRYYNKDDCVCAETINGVLPCTIISLRSIKGKLEGKLV